MIMSSMKELFAVPPKQTKNFIALNVKNIQKKRENVRCLKSSQNRVLKEKNGQCGNNEKSQNTINNIRSRERYRPKAYRHAACQTLDVENDNYLVEEGVIRYPSSQWIQKATQGYESKSIALQTDTKNKDSIQKNSECEDCISINSKTVETNISNNSVQCHDRHISDMPDHSGEKSSEDNVDNNSRTFVQPQSLEQSKVKNIEKTNKKKSNSQNISNNRKQNECTYVNKSVEQCTGLRKHKRGVVPRYIVEKKLEKEREEKKFLEEAERTGILDPDCPPGHILLPNEKRLEQLDYLKQNYNKLINELNRIPVRNDSLKIRQRREVIEKDLDKLEDAIKLFSKEKIFVKP